MVVSDTLGFSTAAQDLLPALIKDPTASPQQLAAKLGLLQTKDLAILTPWVEEVIAMYPEKVAIYQQGKTGLLGFFIAQVMQRSEKKADPKAVSALLRQKLGVPKSD